MKFIDDYQEPYDAEHCRPIIPPDEQIEKAITALKEMSKRIVEALNPTITKLIDAFTSIFNEMHEALKSYPNKRIVYLATHGKERVRKKNIKRIMKWLERTNNGRSEKML